jgi:hypothetical protein
MTRFLQFALVGLTLSTGWATPSLALDSNEELQKIVQTPIPEGLVLEEVDDRFKHNAGCIAYYSLRALERGNQLVDDLKYAPPAKRYYQGNLLLAQMHNYGKWQSSGYVLAQQKALAQAILNSSFDQVLSADQKTNGCSFQYRNRPKKRNEPTLEIFE